MDEIEHQLKNEDIPIFARPMRAMGLAAQKLNMTIPLIHNENQDFSNYNSENMSDQIDKWYHDKYGDLLKIDFSPASYVVLVNGDAFEAKMPRIYGKVRILANRDLTKEYTKISSSSDDLPCCNYLRCIKGLTQKIANQISDEEIIKLVNEFMINHTSINIFENFIDRYEYFHEGFSDYKESVKLILEQKPNYGLSKWETLQFIEKIFKGILKKNNIRPAYTHKLDELNDLLNNKIGIPIDSENIKAISCSPDVRYDKSLVNKADAINAHKKSLLVLSIVIRYLR